MKYKIDTYTADSGNQYYALYKRIFFLGWVMVGSFHETKEECIKRYQVLTGRPNLPGTPEYLP